ncbi:MAG: uroporphyrinogen decarboxylase [Gemmatimonadetes bacterium]|nr:uroporphyrinogen decarboxylase [Gemmatimonadota bacterium]
MPGEAFRAALRSQPAPYTPVWFMRQAGRYLAEYRAIRAKASLLEICHRPELAAEVTLQPVARLGVDAAILFADILLPFEPMGLGLSFAAGEGPVIERPLRTADQIARLPDVSPESDLGHVLQAVHLAVKALGGRVPLIGFAGAPFTLASYAIEGGSSRHFVETKRLMYGDTPAWHVLLDRLAGIVGRYLAAQARAGAEALQLFDSWVGCLSPEDYRRYVLPHSAKAIALARQPGAAVIHFGTGTAAFLDLFAEAGGDVIGVDWRVPLDTAWRAFPDRGIQGNLDPCALFAPPAELEAKVRDVMDRAAGRPGHVFNLGHGVFPDTDPARLRAVVEMVHETVPTAA